MDGLIVKPPFADLIIDGSKTWELRSRSPPSRKIKREVYLLSSGKALGRIKIIDHWQADKEALKQNKKKHHSVGYSSQTEVWEIKVVHKFQNPKKYFHPVGARVWVKNVSFRPHRRLIDFA